MHWLYVESPEEQLSDLSSAEAQSYSHTDSNNITYVVTIIAAMEKVRASEPLTGKISSDPIWGFLLT